MPRIAKALLIRFLNHATVQAGGAGAQALPLPDERYKVDLLLVVAHPDDEGAATPGILRERWTNTGAWQSFLERAGSSGRGDAKPERSASVSAWCGSARLKRATPSQRWAYSTMYGFSAARDTASQNVLLSLGKLGFMAESLEQLVRLVRLTRPEVILTFLPGTFIGEDHGDHQASGVLATEVFDMAGDPAAFPSRLPVQPNVSNHYSRTCVLAAKKDLLLSRCRPRRYLSREGTRLFGERNLQIEQTSILANGARFVPFPPDTSQVLSGIKVLAQRWTKHKSKRMATSDSFWTESFALRAR